MALCHPAFHQSGRTPSTPPRNLPATSPAIVPQTHHQYRALRLYHFLCELNPSGSTISRLSQWSNVFSEPHPPTPSPNHRGGVESSVLKPLSKWRRVWGEVNRFTCRSPISAHGLVSPTTNGPSVANSPLLHCCQPLLTHCRPTMFWRFYQCCDIV